MAKQSTAAANQMTPQEAQEFLILYNKVGKTLEALSQRDEDGKHKMVPFNDENRNSFLKIDKGANWIESFWKNLVSQFKDPTHFNLFAIQEANLDDPKTKRALKDLAAGKETKAVKEFLDKYEIRAKTPEQMPDYGIDWEKFKEVGITREGLVATGMLDEFLKKHAAQAPAQVQQTRYNESLVPWPELEKMGLSREYLVRRGILNDMLNGYKTRDLVPMTVDTGFARVRTEGRLAFMPSREHPGSLKLLVWGIKEKPAFDTPFLGHVFSVEDRKNLMETGHMGRTVMLQHRENEELAESFVSRDKLTNDLYAVKMDDVFIPKEIKNIELSEHEMNELREGRSIKLEGLVSDKGNEYAATIQISAERRGIDYTFENNGHFNAESLGGKTLTQDEVDRLNAGETVKIEGMIDRHTGDLYDRFVKLDPGTGRPQYYSFNPDSPENARQIIIPRYLGGKLVSEQDRITLSEGRPIYMEGMVSTKGNAMPPFVRLDMHTGRAQHSYDPNKFDERPRFEVPPNIHNVQLSATQRAQLQDGKAIKVDGIVATNGAVISQYAKVSRNQTHIELSNDNPDTRRERSQRNTLRQGQGNTQNRGHGIS